MTANIPPFSEQTFHVLSRLQKNSQIETYLEESDAFQEYVETPFQRVFREVIRQLPENITAHLETEKDIFSRTVHKGKKEIWGRYWGALYPKGETKWQAPHLFLFLDAKSLKFGFSWGAPSSSFAEEFRNNWHLHQAAFSYILKSLWSKPGVFFGDKLSKGRKTLSEEWPQQGQAGGVYRLLSKQEALQKREEELVREVASFFQECYALVIIATSEQPLSEVCQYLEQRDETVFESEVYSPENWEEETGFSQEKLEFWCKTLWRKKQIIFYGAPGTGKTFLAEKLACFLVSEEDGFYELLQFHPSYTYEDFIQGIRPRFVTSGELTLVEGRFLDFCRKAQQHQGNCVLIIDEVNRAPLQQVFGELMYLLEYRHKQIPLASGNLFSIPENVLVIGTMNTADRSLALVDYALRRRFAFIRIDPAYDVLEHFHRGNDFPVARLVQVLEEINSEIADPNYFLGISFFLVPSLEQHLASIWQTEIEPYLEEFFLDQPESVEPFRWQQVKARIFS